MKNRFGFGWLTIGLFKPVDSCDKPYQNKFTHQDPGFARTNLLFRARWLAKADAACTSHYLNVFDDFGHDYFAQTSFKMASKRVRGGISFQSESIELLFIRTSPLAMGCVCVVIDKALFLSPLQSYSRLNLTDISPSLLGFFKS